MAVVTVAIEDLDTWLGNQPVNTVDTPYELEITNLSAEDFASHDYPNPNKIRRALSRNNTKYVDLSPTTLPTGITELYYTFSELENLVKPPVLPNGIITLSSTFSECSALKESPVIPSGVKNIVDSCFYSTSITELPVFPSSIESLEQAFRHCNQLTNVTINCPESSINLNYTFEGCSSLVSANLNIGTVTNMQNTFQECTSLTSLDNIVFPRTILNPDFGQLCFTFRGCTSLVDAKNFPIGITSISYAFYDCTSLTEVEIPNGVTDISDAFYGCTSLTETPQLPSSVTDVFGAFYNCSGITEADVDFRNLQRIDRMFEYCSSLSRINIRNFHTDFTSSIYIFFGCSNLINFYCDKQIVLKSWLGDLYSNNYFPTDPDNCNFYTYDYPEASEVPFSELDTFLQGLLGNTAQTPYKLNVTELTVSDIRPSGGLTGSLGNVIRNNSTKYVDLSETTLPNGVIDMTSCFDGCISLTTAPVIPNSVINMYACFLNCTSLTTAPNIPDSVTDMQLCFYTCFSLTTVPNIPNSVTDMSECFFSCSSLEEVTLFEADLESLITNNKAQGCFSDCTSLTKIGVPPSDQPTESDWHAFRLKFGASTVEGKVYDQTGTAVTIPQTTVTKATLELPIKTDELWFPSGLTDNEIDAIIEKVIQYRYTYWNKEVLDPAEKNFVLWADNPVNVKSNLKGMNPVDVVQSGNMNPVTSNAVADKISSLDVSSVGGSGKYISAISETDGKISATATDLGNMVPVDTVTSGNMHSVTSGAVAGAFGTWETLCSETDWYIKAIETKNGKYVACHFEGARFSYGALLLDSIPAKWQTSITRMIIFNQVNNTYNLAFINMYNNQIRIYPGVTSGNVPVYGDCLVKLQD